MLLTEYDVAALLFLGVSALAGGLVTYALKIRTHFAQPGSRHFVSPEEALRRAGEADADIDQVASAKCGSDGGGDYWRRVAERSAGKLRCEAGVWDGPEM